LCSQESARKELKRKLPAKRLFPRQLNQLFPRQLNQSLTLTYTVCKHHAPQ
jgi:hypothetical protein